MLAIARMTLREKRTKTPTDYTTGDFKGNLNAGDSNLQKLVSHLNRYIDNEWNGSTFQGAIPLKNK